MTIAILCSGLYAFTYCCFTATELRIDISIFFNASRVNSDSFFKKHLLKNIFVFKSHNNLKFL